MMKMHYPFRCTRQPPQPGGFKSFSFTPYPNQLSQDRHLQAKWLSRLFVGCVGNGQSPWDTFSVAYTHVHFAHASMPGNSSSGLCSGSLQTIGSGFLETASAFAFIASCSGLSVEIQSASVPNQAQAVFVVYPVVHLTVAKAWKQRCTWPHTGTPL